MAIELTEAETHLAASMAEGRECDFSDVADDLRILRAEALRELLFGQPVRPWKAPEARPYVWPISGVRIRNATITAEKRLYLADLATSDGGPLPPLVLIGCTISCPIRLSGARLRRLSLEQCAVPFVEAPGLVVEGDLVLDDLRSVETDTLSGCQSQPLCWVDLRGARITGSVSAERASLATPPARSWDILQNQSDRYALDLGGASVGGSLNLNPDFKAYGGVRFFQVGGDVYLNAAHLTAEEGNALDAQIAVVGGGAFMRSVMPDERLQTFKADGEVTLAGARIAEDLDMRGARISGSLQLQGIQVGADCRLNSRFLEGELVRFSVGQSLRLNNARIAHDLDLSGADVGSRLLMFGLSVGQDLVTGEIGRRLPDKTYGPASSIPLQVGGDWSLDGAVVDGQLTMTGVRIGGELRAVSATVGAHWGLQGPTGDHLQANILEGGAFLVGNRVGGNFLFTARTGDDVVLAQTTVKDVLELSLNPVTPAASLGQDVSPDGERKGRRREKALKRLLNLDGSSVGVLSDDWGRGVRGFELELNGFQYGRLADVDRGRIVTGRGRWPQDIRVLRRIVIVGGLYLFGSVLVFRRQILALTPLPAWGLWLACGLVACLVVVAGMISSTSTSARQRLKWLARQKGINTGFRPEPYERLSRFYRSQGRYADAREIARRKIEHERKAAPTFLRPFFWLYGLLFDHGMGPERAVAVFIAWIGLGAAGVVFANEGLHIDPGPARGPSVIRSAWPPPVTLTPALVLDRDPVLPPIDGDGRDLQADPSRATAELPCGRRVDPVIYALDSFVPGLDLKHERRCSASDRPDAWAWRTGFAAYSVLGWIVTSLTVLTLSGILRRRAEGG